MLSKHEIDQLVECVKNGIQIPEGYRDILFPTTQKEYELAYSGKMRKEDLLANQDGTFPVPIQIEKNFNGTEYEAFEDGWKNMIIFGDNLQLLKTINENKDSLIKDRVKEKIRLIYIDPPFATESDFKAGKGQKAYNDKVKGSEFIEFLRRRLILAREILSDDGNIVVHLDNKKSHYIKVILDEVFGEGNFINEIIWHKGREGGSSRSHTPSSSMPTEYQNILIYAKDRKIRFWNPILGPFKESTIKNIQRDDNGWYYSRGRMGRKPAKWEVEQGVGLKTYVYKDASVSKETVIKTITSVGAEFVAVGDLWNNQMIKFSQITDYPTEKPEDLIKYIIKAGSQPGDIVLDFFGGSGTTAAVAEKLERKWIVCDIGKLSYYTIQKRILQIHNSNDLKNAKKKYNKKARSFVTAQLGIYDLKKALELEWVKYKDFVANLFGIEIKQHKVAGFEFEGKKGDYYVKIFDYQKFKDSSINESYIKEIHSIIGNRTNGRVYIVAPANFVEFLTDYYEIGDTRYYFLKIPYHMIKELHKKPFQKFRQPRSKNKVNSLDEAIGFHFVRQPEVVSCISKHSDTINLNIKRFISKELESDKTQEEKELRNFETLSAIFIDEKYNDKAFEMTHVYFADELTVKDDIGIEISLNKKNIGKQIMVIYADIYGNDFTEILKF